MADVPSDVRWPPGSSVDFDDIFAEIIRLKELHFPQHTARDLSDPFIQLLVLAASMGQHALGRVNSALLQLSPKTATSRAALVSLMEIVNRPLRPMNPAQGSAWARLKAAPTPGDTIIEAGQKIAQPSTQDPVFSVDSDVVGPTSGSPRLTHYDSSLDTSTVLTLPATVSVGQNDSIIIDLETLAFNSAALTFSVDLGVSATVSIEHRNTESGSPDSVTDLGATLRFDLDAYLFKTLLIANPVGLEVTITHRPTGVSETTTVAVTAGSLTATTGLLGQLTASTSTSDYSATVEWRPVRSPTDGTSGLSTNGSIELDFGVLFDEDVEWATNSAGRYQIRIRVINMNANPDPSSITISGATFDGDLFAVVALTQGVRKRTTIGQADGTSFQFLPVPTEPIVEPINDPEIVITVGTDDEWFIVEDFSNSDATSKHAMFEEDSDSGWGVLFGDGSIGQLPPDGDSVRVTYRTGSTAPGNLSAGAEIRAVGGLGLVDTWTLYRGTDGYAPPEASDRASALRFRAGVLPQLALRAESAITAQEITAALTGGAPNRATFTTSDGRKPFSRAFFTLEGAGTRQYRVIVVGSEEDQNGTISASDASEAEEWLNGVEVGVEIIGGHGPNNTEGIVSEFTSRPIVPTITVTIDNPTGIQDTVEGILKSFFRPHSRDDNEEFRWSIGGLVPLPILFGQLWNAIPGRSFITISCSDGVATYTAGDSIQLEATELPTLSSAFVAETNIIVVVP